MVIQDLMQPTEPKTFVISMLAAEDALPEFMQRGRTGICIYTRVSMHAEVGSERCLQLEEPN